MILNCCEILRLYSLFFLDTMETMDFHCEKCGQSFSDSGMFASHPCSQRQIASSSKVQLDRFKCSRCAEVFSKPAALKHHFKTSHSDPDLTGPFSCSEKGCYFSVSDRDEYQAHIMSTHGLTLVPCTYRACKKSFLTQAEMESHRKGHMPFGCFHCQFVSQNAKTLNGHLLEHKYLPNNAQGKWALRGGGTLIPSNLSCKMEIMIIFS